MALALNCDSILDLEMAIEAHLYPTNAGFPYFVPQFHNETQINQNTLVVDPSLLLLSDSNAYGYTPAANKHNNQPMTTPVSQSLAFEFDKQRDEVDQFIRSQVSNRTFIITSYQISTFVVVEYLKSNLISDSFCGRMRN